MNIEEYIDSASKTRQARLRCILDLIKKLYPSATESIKYKIPTYEYKTGWISVANQKSYLSVYTCMEDHIQEFKEKHPDIKSGKSCINFRDKDQIPYNDLETVIQNALEYVK